MIQYESVGQGFSLADTLKSRNPEGLPYKSFLMLT
jgi:hypothetical protein